MRISSLFLVLNRALKKTWDLKSLWKYSILLEIKALIQLIGFCISQNSEQRSNKRIMSMLKRSSSLKKLPSNVKGKFLKNYGFWIRKYDTETFHQSIRLQLFLIFLQFVFVSHKKVLFFSRTPGCKKIILFKNLFSLVFKDEWPIVVKFLSPWNTPKKSKTHQLYFYCILDRQIVSSFFEVLNG